MKRRISIQRLGISTAIRVAIRVADGLRNAGPVTALCLVMLTVAAAYLASSASAHVWIAKSWIRLLGHPATFHPAESSVQPQSGGSSGYTYTAIDVAGAGTSATEGTAVLSVNASGEIAGIYADTALVAHGFVKTASGTVSKIDAPDAGAGTGQGTFPFSVDSNGDIAGMYIDSHGAFHGFTVVSGTLAEYDAPGASASQHRGTVIVGINTAGTCIGFYSDASSVFHGFLRTANGTFTAINAPGAGTGVQYDHEEGTFPVAIDAAGDVGGGYVDSGNLYHGFVRPAATGTITEFDAPGATTGSVTGINMGTMPFGMDDGGDSAGTYTDSSGARHGFLRSASGTFTTFDVPGAASGSGVIQGTLPFSIDPSGSYIAGGYTDASGLLHGFIRNSSGAITSLSPPGAVTVPTSLGDLSGGTLGFGVNSSGEVVGGYVDTNLAFHGFLATPPLVTPTVTVSASSSSITTAQSLPVIVTVSGGSGSASATGSATLSSGSYTSAPATLSGGSATITVPAGSLAVGNDTLTASYTPDSASSSIYTSATGSTTTPVTVSAPASPVPVLSGISPAYISAGGSAFTLTATGSGFATNSIVYWGATALTTTYGSATQLTAQVTAADITAPGITAITVQTPSPGGGTSTAMQFEVDSGTSGSGPTFTTVTATVAPGVTATYTVTVPSSATGVSVTCLNLPAGSTCSFSSTTGAVTIATSSATPAGTYKITVIFTETLPGAATGLVLLPFLLLPLLFIRRKLEQRGVWLTAGLAIALVTFAAYAAGCGGGSGSSPAPTPASHQATSSGVVTLTVQ